MREKLAENVGVIGENVNISRKRQFFEFTTKKRKVVRIFAWKIGDS